MLSLIHIYRKIHNQAFCPYKNLLFCKLLLYTYRTPLLSDVYKRQVIPTSIANKIIGMVKEISPLYQRATHYNVGGNLTIPSYDESTQKITMAYATEFTALTSTSGKFTSISLSGFLAGALTKVSISLVNNSKFDIVSYVIRKMAEAVAEWIENELINGTASKIEGIR